MNWNIDPANDYATVDHERYSGSYWSIMGTDQFRWAIYRDSELISSGEVRDVADAQEAMERTIRGEGEAPLAQEIVLANHGNS